MNSIGGSSTGMDEIAVVLLVNPARTAVAPSRLGVRGAVLTTSDPYAAAVALLTGQAAALVVDVASRPPQAEAVMALADRRGLPVRALGPDGRIVGGLPLAAAPAAGQDAPAPRARQTHQAPETYDLETTAPADAAGVLTPQELAALLRRDA